MPANFPAGIALALLVAFAVVVRFVLWAAEAHSPNLVPADLRAAYNRADLLYTSNEDLVKFRPEVGNGFLATVVGSNELFVAGVFNGCLPKNVSSGPAPDVCLQQPSHRAALPAPLALHISNAKLGSGPSAALDLRQAAYLRRYLLGKGAGAQLKFYAHRARKSLLVVELTVTKPGSQHVEVKLANPWVGISKDFNLTTRRYTVNNKAVFIVKGQVNEVELLGARPTEVAMVFLADLNMTLRVDVRQTVSYVAAVRTSLESPDPEAAALADWQAAVRMDPSALRAEHTAAWAALWSSGLEVSGRPDVARAVNASLYYILSSIREDTPHSLSPGGLASNSYSGHTFWDTETWMYPPLLLWHPGLASSILQYRVDRVAGAEQKAVSYNKGYRGAMFPWESAALGSEQTPTWAATGTLEQHITGDVTFAARQFWYTTRNKTWLQEAYPALIQKTADFWVSRSRVDSSDGSVHIDHVIPPDEYSIGDDSVYTNYVAQQGLLVAIEAATELGEEPNPQWAATAQHLALLFDPAKGIHPEYRSYDGQRIKQADVVLLGFPLMMPMSTQQRHADLDYYSDRTDPDGPAMTWAMHAIGFLELGNLSAASANFNRSFANAQTPFNVWSETPSGGAVNFITGAGGFLQAALFGLFGLRIKADTLELRPSLLEGMQEIRVRGLHYLGATFRLAHSANGTRLGLEADGSQLSGSWEVRSGTFVRQLMVGLEVTLPNVSAPFELRRSPGHTTTASPSWQDEISVVV